MVGAIFFSNAKGGRSEVVVKAREEMLETKLTASQRLMSK